MYTCLMSKQAKQKNLCIHSQIFQSEIEIYLYISSNEVGDYSLDLIAETRYLDYQ